MMTKYFTGSPLILAFMISILITSFSISARRAFIITSRRFTEDGAELTPIASSLTSEYKKYRTSQWQADFKGVIIYKNFRALRAYIIRKEYLYNEETL